MDNEEIQDTVRLPDEIVEYSIGQFLDGDDTMNLSRAFHSGIGRRNASSPSIYWRKIRKNPKSISISQCYYLKPEKWKIELQYNSEQARILTSFDASHCFWLSAEVLLETVSRMPNLEELLIHDTKITLAHLPGIFKSCPKLNKLSFTLAEENLGKFTELEMGEEAFGWLLKGFKRLTHLKLFIYLEFDIPRDWCHVWPVPFAVLGWCSSRCIDLFIEAYPPTYIEELENEDESVFDDDPLIPDYTMREEHAWMSSLKSLVFIARGSGRSLDDSVDLRFYLANYLLKRFTFRREPNSWERLWVEGKFKIDVNTLNWPKDDVPLTKSLVFWPEIRADFAHDYVGLRQLEHVADVPFSSMTNKPNIKYIRGYCTDPKGLSEFCAEHPMLEHLHFSTMGKLNEYAAFKTITVGNWSLPHLKTIVYQCSPPPVKEIIDHLIVACPNITTLRIDTSYEFLDDFSNPIADVNFLSAIEFSKLTTLSLDGFRLSDGSYMDSILEQCPLLESLHLSGTQEGEFLRKLGDCLPKATNLHDLRVQLINQEEETDVLDFLKKLRGCSNHLKRLVFQNGCLGWSQKWFHSTDPKTAAEFRTFLTSFPLEMPRLVFLCLVGIRFNSDDIAVVEGYWAEKILPDRPGFRHFFGDFLPDGNFPHGVPRIHMDEIVCPVDWFRSPPLFNDIECQETNDD